MSDKEKNLTSKREQRTYTINLRRVLSRELIECKLEVLWDAGKCSNVLLRNAPYSNPIDCGSFALCKVVTMLIDIGALTVQVMEGKHILVPGKID